MRKAFYKGLCVFLIATLLPFTAFAAQMPAEKTDGDIITVIVEVKGDAVLESQNAKALGYKEYLKTEEAKLSENKARSTQAKVQSAIKGATKGDSPVLFTYTHTFNGFAMKINRNDLEKIEALPNVEKVYLDREYRLLEGEAQEAAAAEEASEDEPYMNYGSELMRLEYLHDLGYTGKGLVIAVVDSCFDVNHIMFSETVSEPRLSKNDIADIIKNNSLSICGTGATVTANRVYRSEKIPYAFNYSTRNADVYNSVNDHGTHVAGIAAGNHGIDLFGKRFIGAAPDAQLLFMACTTGEGMSLSNAALLAGMEDGVKLGADVINCSFGGYNDESAAPEYKAVNTARNAGIMVAVAAGNFGRGYGGAVPADIIDYSTLSSPADITATTTVASANNTTVIESFYNIVVDGKDIHYNSVNESVSFYDVFAGKEMDYVYAGKGLISDFENLDVDGKIAFVRHGDIKWKEKALNAQNAGAIGMVVTYETIDATMQQSELVHIPVAVISDDDAEKLLLAEEKKMTLLKDLKHELIHSPKLTMSEFSGWDTERTLEIKPEITAPGGSVFSSLNDDKFGNMSGTSMATPFFSGTSALLMEYMAANPDKYEAQGNRVTLLENLVMSTADVIMQDEEKSIPYSPRKQGAGMANAEKAAKTPVILLGDECEADGYTYRKSKISLREIKLDGNNRFSVQFTARNITNTPVTYDKLSVKVMTDDADEDGYITDMRELTFSAALPKSITVPANSDKDVDILITLDKAELDENMEVFTNGFYIDGYVFLDNDDGNIPMLNIPFAGFYGDWNAQPVFDGYIFDDNLLYGSYINTETKRMPNGGYDSEYHTNLLGSNLFDEKNPDLQGKEYVGISPNFDGEADDLLAVFTPLRIVGKTDFAICDTDGNEIMRYTDGTEGNYYCATKYSASSLGFTQDGLIDLPDGDYVFKVYAGYYYREPYEQNETLEMPFYIDREAPKIDEFSVSNDGGKLSLTVSDNRYLMGIVVWGKVEDGYKSVSYPISPQKSYSTTLDISEFDKDTAFVEVFDYAYNIATISDSAPEFRYDGRKGTEFSFSAYSNAGKDIPCTLILGLYLRGRLVGMATKEETIKSGMSHKYFDLNCDVYDTIKLFAWDNLKNMKPICEDYEF